jgi:hypothetical protein
VHFAHALALLLRTRGVATRLSTGYAVRAAAGGTRDSIVIRASNKHVWPEVFVADIGWVVVDPTPINSLEPEPEPVDDRLARLLGDALRDSMAAEALSVRANGGPVWPAGLMLAGALALLYSIKGYRALVPRFASPRQLARCAYRAALDGLAEVGYWREEGETRERFARRVAHLVPSFAELTGQLLASSLGSRSEIQGPHVVATLVRARRERDSMLPFWRRLAARLHPCPWLFAR